MVRQGEKIYKVDDVIGDYRLTEECGEGGFGQVFLAENTVSGHLVALKILLDPDKGDKELDGLKAFQQCKNEYLIQIHHIGKTDSGLLYYTMDRADNAGTPNRYEADSLDQRIKKKIISPDEVFDLAIHMAEALGTLHKKGLIHRDVKPANIIFVDKKPVLADIGLVTDVERPDVSFAGTAGFLPRYVYAGGHPQCPESDFYALGIVLLCALTGQRDPQKALERNTSMTLSGHSGDLQRLCSTLEDGKDFDNVQVHNCGDFLKCLYGSSNGETKKSSDLPRRWRKNLIFPLLFTVLAGGIGYWLYYDGTVKPAGSVVPPEKNRRNPEKQSATGNIRNDILTPTAEHRNQPTAFPTASSAPRQTKESVKLREISALGNSTTIDRTAMIDVRDLQGCTPETSAQIVAEVTQMIAGLPEPYAGKLKESYECDYLYVPAILYDDMQKAVASWQEGAAPKSSQELVDYLRAEKALRCVTEEYCRYCKNLKPESEDEKLYRQRQLVDPTLPAVSVTAPDFQEAKLYRQLDTTLKARIFYFGIWRDKVRANDYSRYYEATRKSPEVKKLLDEFPLPESLQKRLEQMGKHIPPLYAGLVGCHANIQIEIAELGDPDKIRPGELRRLREELERRADFAKKVLTAEKILDEFPIPESIQKRIEKKDRRCQTIINCNEEIDRELSRIGSSSKDYYSFSALRKQLERRADCIERLQKSSTNRPSRYSQSTGNTSAGEEGISLPGWVMPEAKLVLAKYKLSSYNNVSMKDVKQETRDLLAQYDLPDDVKSFMEQNRKQSQSLYSATHSIELKVKRKLSAKDSDEMKSWSFVMYINDLVGLLIKRRDAAEKLLKQNQGGTSASAASASSQIPKTR